MKQEKNLFQKLNEETPTSPAIAGNRFIQLQLTHFNVPVTELVPGELIQNIGEVIEAVILDGLSGFGNGRSKTRANPAVGQTKVGIRQGRFPT